MGRTIPSYRMKLEHEIKKWDSMKKALRRKDREAFSKLMNYCRLHSDAGGAAVRSIFSDAMFMSILLAHEKKIAKLESILKELENQVCVNR